MKELARAELQLPSAPPLPRAAPVACAAWAPTAAESDEPARHRTERFVEWVELLRVFGVRSILLYLSKVVCFNRTLLFHIF